MFRTFDGWREVLVDEADLARARDPRNAEGLDVSCSECGVRSERTDAGIRTASAELHPYCAGCAAREFGEHRTANSCCSPAVGRCPRTRLLTSAELAGSVVLLACVRLRARGIGHGHARPVLRRRRRADVPGPCVGHRARLRATAGERRGECNLHVAIGDRQRPLGSAAARAGFKGPVIAESQLSPA